MKTLPIRTRLTVWYTAILAIGLAVFGIATWVAMRHSLRAAVDAELQGKIESLQSFITEAPSVEEMLHEFDENSALGPGGELLQLKEVSGAWVYRSPVLKEGDVEIPMLSSGDSEINDVEARGRRFRTLSRPVHRLGKNYVAQVGEPVDDVYEALSTFRWILLALIPPMLALAAAGGSWISRRALRPITDLAQAADSINSDSLSQRLTVMPTGDEVQKLAETLNGMLDRLDDSFQRMVRFTGDASHELRTPVALIRTASEVALRKVRTVEEYQETLRDIGSETERVTSLIGDLLALARADSGLGIMEPKPLELGAVAAEAVHHMNKLAEARGIRIRFKSATGPMMVCGDRSAIHRLLCILLDNAIKYSPSSGDVEVCLLATGAAAAVEVRDQGVGIHPQDLPMIFERFYRADKARSRDSGGAGLGLSIARWIVQAHRGQLSVTSQPGEGSAFRVELPAESSTIEFREVTE